MIGWATKNASFRLCEKMLLWIFLREGVGEAYTVLGKYEGGGIIPGYLWGYVFNIYWYTMVHYIYIYIWRSAFFREGG